MKEKLDTTDLQILNLVQENARMSYGEISEQVGLSVSSVNERLKKLQQKEVIIKYCTQISVEKVGLDTLAFVQILINDPQTEDGFLKKINTLDEVLECHCISGDFSFMLKVRCESPPHLEQFLREKIKTIPGVGRTNSIIALNTSKEKMKLPI